MSQPVNLNKYRKQKTRAEDKLRADRNAVKFGRTKAERQKTDSERDKALRDLDAHRTTE